MTCILTRVRYVRDHSDLFGSSAELALDAVLRLAQRLHIPSDKAESAAEGSAAHAEPAPAAEPAAEPADATMAEAGAEPPKPKADLHGRWVSLLCRLIHSGPATFARKQAKRLLLQLCGTKPRYLEVRDRGMSDAELKSIRQLLAAATQEDFVCGVCAPAGGGAAHPAALAAHPLHLPYETQLRLSSSLQKLHDMCAAQPRNWSRYVALTSGSADGTLAFLLRAAFQLEGTALLGVLRLLSAALRPEASLVAAMLTAPAPPLSSSNAPHPSASSGSAAKAAAAASEAAAAAAAAAALPPLPFRLEQLLNTLPSDLFPAFVSRFALQGSTSAIRQEACSSLSLLWGRLTPGPASDAAPEAPAVAAGEPAALTSSRASLFAALTARLDSLPLYGSNSRELMSTAGTFRALSPPALPHTSHSGSARVETDASRF